MMKKFSTRANKWLYVFVLISHIFNFFAKSKILFFYHIDDHQEDYLFFVDFIEFFYSIFKSIFKSFSFSFNSFSSFSFSFFLVLLFFFFFFFSFRRSFEFCSSSFFVICSIFERSRSLFLFFLSFIVLFLLFLFFLSMFRNIKSVDDVYDVFKNTDIRDNVKNENCDISKMIWFCLDLIRLSVVERA